MDTDRRVEYVDLDGIEPAVRNPKAHDAEGIARSVGHFGLAELPLIDERTGRLVAGHGRIVDLQTRRSQGEAPPSGVSVDGGGRWLVPVIRGWASRSDEDAEAYLLASNQLTIRGGWDADALVEVLRDLHDSDPELALLAGWPLDELDELLGNLDDEAEDDGDPPDPDDVPAAPAKPRTQPGDVWILGPHRIICGDCRDFSTLERLLDGRQVNVAFTSPPYASQRKYDESSGFKPIPPDGYVDWFEDVQANIRAVLAPDGSWFVNIKEHCDDGQRHLYVKDLTIAHVRLWGWRFVDELIWHKPDPFPGGWDDRFKNGWEPVFQFAPAKPKFRPEAVLVDGVRSFTYNQDFSLKLRAGGKVDTGIRPTAEGKTRPSNVVTLAVGTASSGNDHSAAFPLGLPAWFLRAYSDEGDVILDPFMGSGTTLLAAHDEGRVGFGVELSPGYCDVICRRFQITTGIVPILESTGKRVDFADGRTP